MQSNLNIEFPFISRIPGPRIQSQQPEQNTPDGTLKSSSAIYDYQERPFLPSAPAPTNNYPKLNNNKNKMGNSNSSIGQFTPNDIDLRHRAHWQYLSQQQQQQNQRGSSFPGNDPNTINTSIKVLPELNDTSGHLRSTDNGMILFNGGTISGRRDASAVGVVRSKSISSPQHEYMRGLQRHKTQLDMPVQRTTHGGNVKSEVGGGGLRRDVDPKLFGSEPDLRLSPADGGPPNGRNSRKFKGQPTPKSLATSAQQQQQQQREYDSTRFGWRPKSSPSHHNHHLQQGHGKPHPQNGNQSNHHQQQNHNHHQDRLPINEQAKKPRLFKTREETKKVSSKANQSKLATEASDVQSKKPIPGRQINGKRETERIRGKFFELNNFAAHTTVNLLRAKSNLPR